MAYGIIYNGRLRTIKQLSLIENRGWYSSESELYILSRTRSRAIREYVHALGSWEHRPKGVEVVKIVGIDYVE